MTICFSKFGDLGASSRLRMYQYKAKFLKVGVHLQFSPLIPNSMLQRRYEQGRYDVGELFFRYITRVVILLKSRERVIWLQSELLPYVPFWVERLLLGRSTVVIDVDDAIFHKYDHHRNYLVRSIFSSKIDKLYQRADLVVAGNPYLANRAKMAGARAVAIVPTVVELEKYSEVKKSINNTPIEEMIKPFRVGWIGSPTTCRYLDIVMPALTKLLDEFEIELVVVGGSLQHAKVPIKHYEWSEESEAESISSFDIGIMPVPDEAFERGKCGYKLIQYMAMGVPFVCSPIGVNIEICEKTGAGFLARNDRDWYSKIKRLIIDVETRREMAKLGERAVKDQYNLDVMSARYIELFQSLEDGSL